VDPTSCDAPEAKGTVLLYAEGSEYEVECKRGFDACSRMFVIELRNCTSDPVGIHQVAVTFVDADGKRHSRRLRDYGGRKQIAVGEVWQHKEELSDVGIYEYAVTALSPDGTDHIGRQTFTATNPALQKAKEDCRACNGYWGPLGLSLETGCLCRTNDAGKRCTDGDQCTGVCLYDKDAKPVADEPPDVLVGRCSEREVVYGCFDYIPKGASKQAVPAGGAQPQRICVD